MNLCGDNGCYFGKPTVGTNRGCRCLDGIEGPRRVTVRDAILALRAALAAKDALIEAMINAAKDEADEYLHADTEEYKSAPPAWRALRDLATKLSAMQAEGKL